MSLAWDQDNTTPDVPVVTAALWRGIAYAMLPSLALLVWLS